MTKLSDKKPRKFKKKKNVSNFKKLDGGTLRKML